MRMLLWCYALILCHVQVVLGACTRLSTWIMPRCMVAIPEAVLPKPSLLLYQQLESASKLSYQQSEATCRFTTSLQTTSAGARHPIAYRGGVDPSGCRPYVCRFSAQNYGAKVGIVELPFAFIPDNKHGGAGGTCVATCTCLSELRRPQAALACNRMFMCGDPGSVNTPDLRGFMCRCVIRGCVPKKLLVYGWVASSRTALAAQRLLLSICTDYRAGGQMQQL